MCEWSATDVEGLRAVPAREPAKQGSKHESGLRRQRDGCNHADDDAERQAQHRSKSNGGSDAHMGESMLGASARRRAQPAPNLVPLAFNARAGYPPRVAARRSLADLLVWGASRPLSDRCRHTALKPETLAKDDEQEPGSRLLLPRREAEVTIAGFCPGA